MKKAPQRNPIGKSGPNQALSDRKLSRKAKSTNAVTAMQAN